MIRFLLLITTILSTCACSRHETVFAAKREETSPVEVRIQTVAVSQTPDLYRASGTLRAKQVADITSRISANIVEVRVRAGDHVQAGQTLVVLDRRELAANLRRAEAARIETESAIAESENAIASARATVDLARTTHQRFHDLLAKASVSQQEFDESQARFKTAEAAVEMTLSKRRQVEARRGQAEAEVAVARIALDYATLSAPFAGLVTERKADPDSLATPAAPLLTVEREGNLRLEASLDESRLGLARIDESVTVEIDGMSQSVTGRVREIVPSIDPATRTFTAKIDLPALPGIRAGMFARAAFVAGARRAMLVPQSAIVEHGQTRCVYVVEANTARLRFVTVGEFQLDGREILSGLTPGEKVVVAPPAELTDGGRVSIQGATP